MFSALRQGALVYILDKSEKPSIKTGQVEGVTQPRFNPQAGFGQTVVDISVKIGMDKKDFVGVPSNATIHSSGSITISESRESMIQEINSMLRTSKSVLESVEYNKNVIETCEEMLKEIDPDFKKQQEQDDTINNLKEEMSVLKGDVNKILSLLTQAKTN